MMHYKYKHTNGKSVKPINGIQVDKVGAKDGTVNSFLISVFEQTHSDNHGNTFEGFEFRARDLNVTKGERISLWVTKFKECYQNTMIEAEGTMLRQKSLPETLIIYASIYLKSDITSSTKLQKFKRYDIDFRHEDGEKVWKRLEKMEDVIVSYDETSDRFKLHYS
ncbi:MAG: hypothetical protein NXI10_01210 [bacterium]|nr:hypothetical protein [bacterium]